MHDFGTLAFEELLGACVRPLDPEPSGQPFAPPLVGVARGDELDAVEAPERSAVQPAGVTAADDRSFQSRRPYSVR